MILQIYGKLSYDIEFPHMDVQMGKFLDFLSKRERALPALTFFRDVSHSDKIVSGSSYFNRSGRLATPF